MTELFFNLVGAIVIIVAIVIGLVYVYEYYNR